MAVRVCAECALNPGTFIKPPPGLGPYCSAARLLPTTLPANLSQRLQSAAVSVQPLVLQGRPITFTALPPATADPAEMLRYLNASPTVSPPSQAHEHQLSAILCMNQSELQSLIAAHEPKLQPGLYFRLERQHSVALLSQKLGALLQQMMDTFFAA